MRKQLTLMALVTTLAVFPQLALGQELLTNPSLELDPPDDGGRYTVAPGWFTSEGPAVVAIPDPAVSEEEADYNDNGIVDAADYVVWRDGGLLLNEVETPGEVTQEDYDAWRARFGNGILSTSEPSNFGPLLFDGDWQHWFQPYTATFAEVAEGGFAHLFQDVPGTPGMMYTMTGNALFEAHYAGGVDNLNDGSTPEMSEDGPPSPTDSFFGLEFLDADGMVLPGSVEIELKADGQMNSVDIPLWMEHTLSAVAPAGTVNVRVRASMEHGVWNEGVDPQSFFVDLFSLTATTPGGGAGLAVGAVPEPGSWMLASIALGMLGATRRKICIRGR